MGKARKKTKKSVKFPKSKLASLALIVIALAVYLAVVWFYISQSYGNQPLQTGHFASAETYASQDYSNSLDLRIAAKASYPSSAITKVKNLGLIHGVDEQIFSFGVPTDKLTEYGLMTLPSTRAPVGGYPTIILCHGYLNPNQYSTTTGYISDMDFYTEHGYAVLKPDYRGQGLSINEGSPDGATYSMAYNTDVMSLITAVNDTSYLNKNDVNLWGHSMGAYIALRAAVLSPEIKNLILLSGPVGTPQAMFSDYLAISDKDNPVALQLREAILVKYGTPVENPKFWDATSPIDFISKVKAHIQIYVGLQDHTVPPIFSAELDAALTKAGKPHQYYVFSDGDHGLAPQRPVIWQDSLALLNKSLPN